MKKIISILICFPSLIFGQLAINCTYGDCDNGEGIKTYSGSTIPSDNRLHEGWFKNGKADGFGTCYWTAGGSYEGDWENDKQSGEGIMAYSNGDKYIGAWENGQRDGFGTYIWDDGHKFKGEWKKNIRYGEGIMTYPDSYIGPGFKAEDHTKTSKILFDRIITHVYAGSPAETAGLLVGDVILLVNKLHYDVWEKAEGSKKIGGKHKFLIKKVNGTKQDKAKNIKVRIAKVSKKGSGDLMSYDGEWIDGKFDGIGTAIYYNDVKESGVWNAGKFTKSLVIEDRIREMVESKINEWQKKDEFEKTIEYQERVNDKNRDLKVKEFEELALQDLKSEFCKSVDWSTIELGKYEPDDEVFILKGGKYRPNYYDKDYPLGDIVIPVPRDTARYFKKNFSSFDYRNLDCVTSDDNFILSYVELHGKEIQKSVWSVDSTFNPWDSTYNVRNREEFYYEHPMYPYSLDDAHDYTLTEIDWVFADIKIDEVEDAMINQSIISRKKLNVGTSAVNLDIPIKEKVDYRYALVIGNEDYTSKQTDLSAEQNVPYAINDANIFREYALKTLGVKEEHMYDIIDATSVEMQKAIALISGILKAHGSEAELIVYYAGHGQPDENTHVPYLIPVDVNAKDFIGAVKLDDIYRDLSATGANRIIIFLDACFTGGARGDGLMASRGVTVEPRRDGELSGNLLVFSASSGKESSLAYDKEEHGIFTYYLLKKLQESDGDVSMGALADYLTYTVPLESLKINEKNQNPVIRVSPEVENNWRNWTF